MATRSKPIIYLAPLVPVAKATLSPEAIAAKINAAHGAASAAVNAVNATDLAYVNIALVNAAQEAVDALLAITANALGEGNAMSAATEAALAIATEAVKAAAAEVVKVATAAKTAYFTDLARARAIEARAAASDLARVRAAAGIKDPSSTNAEEVFIAVAAVFMPICALYAVGYSYCYFSGNCNNNPHNMEILANESINLPAVAYNATASLITAVRSCFGI